MKLQPNFSWQSYQGRPEDQATQFQFQLQQMHVKTANAINSTIDDLSYFLNFNNNPATPIERPTGFAWVDQTQIYKITVPGLIVGSTTTGYPHGIVNLNTVVQMYGTAQDEIPVDVAGIPLPYIDPTTLANGVGISIDPTNVYVNAGNNAFDSYFFYITVFYTKFI